MEGTWTPSTNHRLSVNQGQEGAASCLAVANVFSKERMNEVEKHVNKIVQNKPLKLCLIFQPA